MMDTTRTGEAWEAEDRGLGWAGWFVRATLAVYLLPALLVALAVGGLALAIGSVVRFLKTIGAGGSSRRRPMAPLAGRGPHLRGASGSVILGQPGREPQPWS